MPKRRPTSEHSDEERKIRVRMAELGLTVKSLADAAKILPQDVSKVIGGYSKCPKYVTEVYKYLGLDMPKKGKSTA